VIGITKAVREAVSRKMRKEEGRHRITTLQTDGKL
jgi:hypothetical protein